MSADLQDEQTLLFRDIVIICIHYQLFPSSLSHDRRSDIRRRGMYRKAPKPPIDEVVSWRQSLKKLQESKTGQLAFREFLRTEYSEENILFWLACEEYKTITTSNEIAIAAKRIYTEFVQVDAPRQINIDCGTRQEITNSMSQPTLSCFDKAQRLIYKLMKKDCYPRFLKSEIYQGLLEPSEAS
ncbi:regulator of G-protein signaling 21 isoform X3 [Salmo salar]|uniref:Regulator of G-protein signaling 1 n=1 Tax=Salmo salar TaxID=8030 RepID=A0A1S3KJA8_SALSA|nr:regulator of G-protein signaling 21 isoform X3 [Salmo salar]|eukprot:XP_013978675.1 PREDICTED: regulator of G-protein signaling 21-like isoform X2 [Salmo salar]